MQQGTEILLPQLFLLCLWNVQLHSSLNTIDNIINHPSITHKCKTHNKQNNKQTLIKV